MQGQNGANSQPPSSVSAELCKAQTSGHSSGISSNSGHFMQKSDAQTATFETEEPSGWLLNTIFRIAQGFVLYIFSPFPGLKSDVLKLTQTSDLCWSTRSPNHTGRNSPAPLCLKSFFPPGRTLAGALMSSGTCSYHTFPWDASRTARRCLLWPVYSPLISLRLSLYHSANPFRATRAMSFFTRFQRMSLTSSSFSARTSWVTSRQRTGMS